MATTLDQIVDLFGALNQDYRLVSIFQTSGSLVYQTYIEPWCLLAIKDFADICNQTLNYNTSTQSFDIDLTTENQLVIAQVMQVYWLQKAVNDVAQFTNFLSDHDFQRHSESANLQIKLQLLNQKREEIDLLLSKYAMKYNNWGSWQSQNFGQGTTGCYHSIESYPYRNNW